MKLMYTFVALLLITSACKSNNNATSDDKTVVFETINVNDFETKIDELSDAYLLDVRTPQEFEGGHIEHALNYNWNSENFKTQVQDLDKSKPVLVYCLSGGRSGQAMQYLESQGFQTVYNLQGGIMAWNNAGKNTTKATTTNANAMSTEDYQQLISSSNLVLVQYFAPWCAPCKKLSPIVENLEQEMNGTFKLSKLNYDEQKAIANANGVSAIPVLILYKNGKEVWRNNGLTDKATIETAINKFK